MQKTIVNLSVFGKETVTIADHSQAGGTFQWTIPESFYSQIPNAKSGTGTIGCSTYNGDTLIGEKTSQFTATTNEEKCKPSVDATVVDTNQNTIELTGNSSKLVKYNSTAKVTVTASAKNSASISSKKVNNVIISGDNISIQKIETDTFIVTVTDSRGYSNSVTLKPSVINYIPLSINANIKRTQPTTGEVSLTFTGNYYNGSFGSVNNQLSMAWKYKEYGASSWINGGNISPVINNNTYSNGSATISLGTIFDYQKSYEFMLIITDKITTLQPTYIVTQGVPIFNWGKDFVNIFGTLKIKGVSILELMFPIGSTYITQENTNPNEILGFGTWERYYKLLEVGLNENDEDFKTIGKTGGEKQHTLTENELPSIVVAGAYNTAGEGWTLGNGGIPQLYTQGNTTIGKGQAFNVTPPYEVVGYKWIRRS